MGLRQVLSRITPTKGSFLVLAAIPLLDVSEKRRTPVGVRILKVGHPPCQIGGSCIFAILLPIHEPVFPVAALDDELATCFSYIDNISGSILVG